jgi:hypothetical protein
MNERIRELSEQAKIRPALLLQHLGTFAALTDSEQQELKNIEKFAELVQADEREACAKVCEDQDTGQDLPYDLAVIECAKAIRARGGK